MLFAAVLTFILQLSLTQTPTWVPSTYIQAGTGIIINNVRVGSGSPRAVTISFPTAFTLAPNFAYGIVHYEANDYMANQKFELKRNLLTPTNFRIQFTISGWTNIWYLQFRYVGIDRNFPHHLNSFDNIPLNYSRGPLINITNTRVTTKWYINTINYTKQCIDNGYNYKLFAAPFTNIKILLFTTTLFHRGDNECGLCSYRPLNLVLATNVISFAYYTINATYSGNKAKIQKLHFSIIIFDQANVEANGNYTLVYQKVSYGSSGGFTAVPQQFTPNLMYGMVEYATKKTRSAWQYNLKHIFNPSSPTTFGVYMPSSAPRNRGTPFIRLGLNIFYMKTWICPAGIVFDITQNKCVSCQINNCQVCATVDLCQTCNAGYFFNYGADTPSEQCSINCPILYCTRCKNQSFCEKCNQALNYFDDNAGHCIYCPIPNCTLCQSLTVCQTCDSPNSFIKNPSPTGPSDQCILCPINQCLVCSTLTTCALCNEQNNYFWYSPLSACVACNITGCIKCLSLTQCTICDEANFFFLNIDPLSSQKCVYCPIPNCASCENATVCLQCNTLDDYHLSGSMDISTQCMPCIIPHCNTCSDLVTCSQCDELNNYFLNNASIGMNDQCVICLIPYCISCINQTNCLVCNQSQNYFVDNTYTSCIYCVLPGCILCLNLTQCLICNQSSNYFLDVITNECILCNLSNCLQCNSLSTCSVCDSMNLYYPNPNTGQCQIPPPICGDNILMANMTNMTNEDCDDGNLINGDGCSSFCTVQPDYICQPNPIPLMFNSQCYYMGEISINVVLIEKLDGKNQIYILLELNPKNLSYWNGVNFSSMVTLSYGSYFDNYTVTKNENGSIQIYANYNTDIHNLSLTVQLDPKKSGKIQLSKNPSALKSFYILPEDNEAAYFYDQQVYEKAKIISYLCFGVAGLALLIFIISIVCRKVVGVELMGVIQISYLSLFYFSYSNPCFKALSFLWISNGFNLFSMSKQHLLDSNSPNQIKMLGFYSQMYQNYNITFSLILIPWLLSIILLVISKAASDGQKKLKYQSWTKIFLFQFAFNGLMFSAYVISASATIQIIYGIKNIQIISLVETGLVLLTYIVYFILLIKTPESFGQFSTSFQVKSLSQQRNCIGQKAQCINQKWYNILMIQRLVVGSSLIVLLKMNFSLAVGAGFFFILGLYSLICRPYVRSYHNNRYAYNMLTCIGVQVIFLFYDMASISEQNKQSIWFLMPLIVCGLLFLCVIINLVALIYDLAKDRQQQIKKQEDKQFWNQLNLTTKKDEPQSFNTTLNTINISENARPRQKMKEVHKLIKQELNVKGKNNVLPTEPGIYEPEYDLI